jgi:antitoxin CcdA
MRMKRATNLSVDASLLEEAKALGLNLSRVLEDSLRARVAQEKQERWLRENAKGIAAHNERVETRGAFSDRLRRF